MNKRQIEVEKAKLKAEEKELKHLKTIYNKAAQDISEKITLSNGKIDVLLSRIDDLDDIEKSILQSQIYQREFQKSLKTQIDGFLKDLHSKQYSSVDEYLKDCYETGYIGSMYDIAGQGIPIVKPIDQKKVVAAMTTDSKISKRLYTKLGEDVDFLKKRIANNLSRGIATGSGYKAIARNIAADSNMGFNRAMRIARTEGHRIQITAADDAQHIAKKVGADVVKQWSAALDGRTRPTHRQLDGQIREVDEPFEVDGRKVMYPSGFGDPAEDVNCRCALLQRAVWNLDEDELQKLKDRAAYYGLDKTKEFDEFKKKYLKATENDEMVKYNEDYQARIKERRKSYFARKATEKAGSKPDFTEMKYADVMKWADANLKTTFEGLKGANREFVKETVKALEIFERKMGGTIEGLSVKFGGLSGNIVAKYDDKTKTLLLKKTGSLEAFENKLKEENARYRAKWKNNKDYNATDTFSGTVLHELGHAVDIDTGQSLSSKLGADKELYIKSVKVSAYAGTQMNVRVTKASEAWAENFAAYMAGGANAKKVPDEIKEMIEDYFKTKKTVENSAKSSRIIVHKSLGAAAKNYQVKLMEGNGHTRLVENQKIEGKTFAGRGTDSEIRDRFRLESDYHIPADEWEKVSGKGYVILDGKRVLAELHWYEADGEIYEMKVKRYLDES